MKVAGLAVDIQKTFFPDGSLGVSGANSTAVVNFAKNLYDLNIPIIASQDSHPKGHVSFVESGGIWPIHGLKNGGYNKNGLFEGDDLLPGLPPIKYVQKKGENPNFDSYSAFRDEGDHETKLDYYLKYNGYTTLIVFGEAGNYCVMASIIDAIDRGYNVILVSDMTHYIPNTSETERDTIKKMSDHAKNIGVMFKTIASDKLLEDVKKAITFNDDL